jgi:hypothetical protein
MAWVCAWTSATKGPIVHLPDDMSMDSHDGMILTGENRRTRKKTCPSATLSTTNPIWTDPDANPDRRGGHGTAWKLVRLQKQTLMNNMIIERDLYPVPD